MGFESPTTSPDGNIEKPKTFKDYYDRVKIEIERIEKRSVDLKGKEFESAFALLNTLKDELGRLDGYVSMYTGSLDRFDDLSEQGKEQVIAKYLERPLSSIVDDFAKFVEEKNQEYKEKFGGKNINELFGDEEQEAKDLIESSDILDKISSRMTKFES
ncbi:hypothetical protein H0W91_04285 [Patescibacteria group bacterium]|nr:hypothetical protein [Patescibacteria group bacterium]